MNFFVPIVTSSLNCFAIKPGQTKVPLAPAVTMAQNEYSPLSLLFLKAVKGHLPRLGEVPLVAHALPQVVTPAKHSSLREKLQRTQIGRTLNGQPVKISPKHVITVVSQDD
jgi:hypothetical protein